MSLLQTQASVSISSGEQITFGAVSAPIAFTTTPNSPLLTDGTGANQGKHGVKMTAATSTGGVTLDLTAIPGGLNGSNVDFSANAGTIKYFLLENTDGTNTITVTQPVSHGWTGISGAATGLNKVLNPGDCIFLQSAGVGMAVTSTNCLLTLTSGAGTPNYRLTAVG